MDDARAMRTRDLHPWTRALKKAQLKLLSSRWGIDTIAAISGLYRAAGFERLIEKAELPIGTRLRAYHRLATQLRRPKRVRQVNPKAPGEKQGVALFLGCVAPAAQPELSTAACRVLERLGYAVQVPDTQCCCGAMHRHNGHPQEADHMIARNAAAFAGLQTLVTASACFAELREHSDLSRTQEICRFLADLDWPEDVLRPLRARVTLHEPCSHRNVLRDAAAAYDLLRRIPEIELLALDDNAFCCGAAGTYLLDDPAMSATLLTPKIEHLRRLGADILVTTNTGCAMHLAAGIREAGLDTEVLHPVELIERQLSD